MSEKMPEVHPHLEELEKFIRAGVPTIWLATYEEVRAMTLLKDFIGRYTTTIIAWDVLQQGKVIYGEYRPKGDDNICTAADPVAVIQEFTKMQDNGVLLIIKDAHKFVQNIDMIRAIKIFIAENKSYKNIIFMSHKNAIPEELEKDVHLAHLSLPNKTDIEKVISEIVTSNEIEHVTIQPEYVRAIQGLTFQESVNCVSLCLAQHKKLDRLNLERYKLEAVKKSGMMEIFPAVEPNQLGGLDLLKTYMELRAKGFEDENLPTPVGILLMGLPGGGKSLSAKVIASMLKMPLIKLDIASLKSKYVGESESKMGQALQLIDAVSPVVVWLDEIEKSVGGVLSSNRSDGGTSSAMFGKLLTWMQESLKPKFIVATCNDIQPLLEASHGALIRRFDDIIFVDTPSNSEKEEILAIHNAKYNSNVPVNLISKMTDWTGAEIEKVCKASKFEGVQSAFDNIRPIYEQNKELFTKMRAWAAQNARPANRPKTYIPEQPKKAGRKINI